MAELAPAGPLDPSASTRSGEPSASSGFCPTTSSKVLGRIRTANGVLRARRAWVDSSVLNRSSVIGFSLLVADRLRLRVDTGFLALLGSDRRRGSGQRIVSSPGLGEGDDLAD